MSSWPVRSSLHGGRLILILAQLAAEFCVRLVLVAHVVNRARGDGVVVDNLALRLLIVVARRELHLGRATWRDRRRTLSILLLLLVTIGREALDGASRWQFVIHVPHLLGHLLRRLLLLLVVAVFYPLTRHA